MKAINIDYFVELEINSSNNILTSQIFFITANLYCIGYRNNRNFEILFPPGILTSFFHYRSFISLPTVFEINIRIHFSEGLRVSNKFTAVNCDNKVDFSILGYNPLLQTLLCFMLVFL